MYAEGADRQIGRWRGRRGGDREGGGRRAAVAAVLDARQRHLQPDAVPAGRPVPEEAPARADQPVVVQRDHRRDPAALAGGEHGRAQEGEQVVDVHDVGLELVEHRHDVPAGLRVPDDLGRDERLAGGRERGDVVAEQLEPPDDVAGVDQRGVLLVDHPVLAARRRRPVTVVDDEDLHWRGTSGWPGGDGQIEGGDERSGRQPDRRPGDDGRPDPAAAAIAVGVVVVGVIAVVMAEALAGPALVLLRGMVWRWVESHRHRLLGHQGTPGAQLLGGPLGGDPSER